jgi:hypothetical protein
MKTVRLSPFTLNLYLECPRCFWLDKNKGIKRPRGIYPSLPGGMDLLIKSYFDKCRLKGELPKEIKDKVKGKLFPDIAVLEKWRNWRLTDLVYEDKLFNVLLVGALDDCVVEDNFYIPLDYKTRGSDLKEDPRIYYQTQLDCYCLMLESSGYKTKGIAYLIYYWPEEVKEGGIVKFHVESIEVATDIESSKRIVRDAAILLSSHIPKASSNCEYCGLIKNRKDETRELDFDER